MLFPDLYETWCCLAVLCCAARAAAILLVWNVNGAFIMGIFFTMFISWIKFPQKQSQGGLVPDKVSEKEQECTCIQCLAQIGPHPQCSLAGASAWCYKAAELRGGPATVCCRLLSAHACPPWHIITLPAPPLQQ